MITLMKTEVVEKKTGASYMIENKRVDELNLMYKCFCREESNLNIIVCCLGDHIEEKGKKIVNDDELIKHPTQFT